MFLSIENVHLVKSQLNRTLVTYFKGITHKVRLISDFKCYSPTMAVTRLVTKLKSKPKILMVLQDKLTNAYNFYSPTIAVSRLVLIS